MSKYESIQYSNVYSRRYNDIAPSDVRTCVEAFCRLFQKSGLTVGGNLLYVLHKVDAQKASIEFMLSARESRHKGVEELNYRSYLMIPHMTSVVVRDDFEENMGRAYLQLVRVAKDNGMKIISPFYHDIFSRGEKTYCVVKVVMA